MFKGTLAALVHDHKNFSLACITHDSLELVPMLICPPNGKRLKKGRRIGYYNLLGFVPPTHFS